MSSRRARRNIAGSWSSEVLTPRDSLLPSTCPASPLRRAAALGTSLLVHLAALGFLFAGPSRALPTSEAPLEIELVQQQAETRGAPPPPQPESKPAPSAPPTAAADSPAPPSPDATSVPRLSKSAAAAQPTRSAQRPAPSSTEVNLGNALRDVDPLTVTGTNVVPAAPDSRYKNAPPHYPAAAARIGAEGTVEVVAHIAPSGQPVSVGVVTSSGNPELDDEAQRAVMRWHFQPARQAGQPVPFDYVIKIRFALNGH